MKNKDLIYLALGLGALYFFTKKKDTETTETTETTTPDIGNDKNDPVVDDVADVIDTGVVVDSTTGGSSTGGATQGGSLPDDFVVYTTV